MRAARSRPTTLQGPIQFTVGVNSGEKIMIDEMAKLEACRLLSLDVDKWGRMDML